MTVFMDIESGRIFHAVEGRSRDKIQPFLEKLSRKVKKLKAVAMDISSSYFSAVRAWLPSVDIVLGCYHVAALMNQAIDEIRRGQQRELDAPGQKTLKGNRFLLLKSTTRFNLIEMPGSMLFLQPISPFLRFIP